MSHFFSYLPRCLQLQSVFFVNPEDDEYLIGTEPKPSSPICNRLKRWAGSIVGGITATGALGTAVYYNIVRDLVWPYVTYEHYAPDFRQGDDWPEANGAQWAYGTAAMIVAILPHYLACRASSQKLPWANTCVSIIAASLAIPGWNIAAKSGISLGQQIGFSTTSAGYFAGLFTGLAEGPIQEAVTSLGQYITSSEEKEKYKNDPCRYFINFLKRFCLSASIGAIPGDVWQFVYNAGQTNNLGSIPTTLMVATSVAISNVVYDKIKNATLLKPIIVEDNNRYQLVEI